MSNATTATGTEAKVCADIASRQKKGICKYGVAVADNPLTLRQWINHAYEEGLDQVVYLRRILDSLYHGDMAEKQPAVASAIAAPVKSLGEAFDAKPNPAGVETRDAWKLAVIDACTVNHIGWQDNDPHWTVKRLLDWECKQCLDPEISNEAAALRDTYLGKLQEVEAVLAQTRSTVEALRKNLNSACARADAWKRNATNLAESIRGNYSNLPASLKEHADLRAADGTEYIAQLRQSNS